MDEWMPLVWILAVAIGFLTQSYRASPILMNQDVWMEIANHLNGRDILRLSMTCSWLRYFMEKSSVWKMPFLRENEVEDPGKVEVDWKRVYASALYHASFVRVIGNPLAISWFEPIHGHVRVGAFLMVSDRALLVNRLTSIDGAAIHNVAQVTNVKRGPWIVDLLFVHHSALTRNPHDQRSMHVVLDARHCEVPMPCKNDDEESDDESEKEAYWWWDSVVSEDPLHPPKERSTVAVFDAQHQDEYGIPEFDIDIWSRLGGLGGHVHDWDARVRKSAHSLTTSLALEIYKESFDQFLVRRSEDGEAVGMRMMQTFRFL